MQKRSAFTLVELILAVFIFSYMSASLATIYGTANRHMFQNYRRNIIKTNVVLAMRAIQNGLTVATRIDLPADNSEDDRLAFASNVDMTTGCYPINPAEEVRWHYLCLADDPEIPGSQSLFYHTNRITPVAATACAAFPPPLGAGPGCAGCWNTARYPVTTCGVNNEPGQVMLILMRHVLPRTHAVYPRSFIFSRRTADRVPADGSVLVRLRSSWTAGTRGFGASQRDVDYALNTLVTGQIRAD